MMYDFKTFLLGDVIVNFDSLRVPIRSSERKPGSYPYYGASGIVDRVDAYIFDGDYLLIAEDGENLRTRKTPVAFMASGKFWVNNHAHVVQGNHLANVRYLAYALVGIDISGYLSGSTQPKLTQAAMNRIAVRLPSRKCQDSIVEVLGAFDDKIAVKNQIAKTARSLAWAHFREVINSGGASEFVLSSVVELFNRGIAPNYTEDQSQLRVLNQKCIRDGRVSLGPSRWTLGGKVVPAKLLKPNDVLVNSTGMGTLGRVARWTRDDACTVDSHVTIVRFDETRIDPVCAGFAMLSAEPEIEALGEGSTGQTELSRGQLSGLRITLPSRDSAKRLRPVLTALENLGDSALGESDALAKLRDSLLPRLMSGEIRVREAEKVVGDVT